MEYIYVLQCTKKKYYVGKSINVDKRYQEHLDGSTAWTAKYTPLKILETVESLTNTSELNKTLEYMERYGIDNVRGGPWCQLNIQHYIKYITSLIHNTIPFNGCHYPVNSWDYSSN